ncbi:MAG: carbohydrate-binding family 6 protein [Acidobacteria bacterium]|nr:carbohydrate-binding family 6 protein [Acidobacteriota bacterium]
MRLENWILPLLVLTGHLSAQSRPALFYDRSMEPLAFAAGEISRAAASAIPEYSLDRLPGAACSPCLVLAAGATQTAQVAKTLGVSAPRSSEAQAYAIRRGTAAGRTVIAVLGADAAGAMYGGLDVAEALRLGTLDQLRDSDRVPHIAQRGIKFNIPLDARTPSYSDNADAAQYNIPEMWSFDFWREFLDEMARHRYNVLSLWNLHPFPSLVRVPEYPEVALDDVKRTTLKLDDSYSHSGSDMARPQTLARLETVKTIAMGEKIRFWRDVMRHARNRGIDVYVITWNLFTFGAEGKHGITTDQTNPKTIGYLRASVREMVLTYPLLAGMGVTAGENMRNPKGEFSNEKFLWKTYGEGIRDALKLQPGRQFRMIHRYHMSGQSEILNEWKDYPGPFDLSFKYSIAHMYSIPNPPFIQDVLANLPADRRTWLTVRNDDIYSFRWGDPAYARAYIRHIPPREKIAGSYMGPDGYTWGREFLSTEPETPRQLVISKQWYSFLLWGRLSYDPELPDALFERIVAQRFPEAPGGKLYRAWADASQVFPLITRFFWGDIDLRWFPEACLSHPKHCGFYTVRHFVEGETMPGSGVLNILEWRRRKLASEAMNGTTPLETADALDGAAARTLAALPELRAAQASNKELRLTLGDLEAMAWLGRYYANKIRGAASLALYDQSGAESDKAAAVRSLGTALDSWYRYSGAYAAQYMQPRLYNRVGFVDIPALSAKAAEDVEIARRWTPGTVKDAAVKRNSADRPFRK